MEAGVGFEGGVLLGGGTFVGIFRPSVLGGGGGAEGEDAEEFVAAVAAEGVEVCVSVSVQDAANVS